NHWTNQTGKMIQPADFKAARAGKFPAGGATPGAAAPAAAAAPASAAQEATSAPAAAAPATGLPYQVFFATGDASLDAEAQ
ncbi:hypothetical protein, partial [Escherichia coli]|uniref:hypothetical protein n=1 Tax=Escherichia coli TaxID=562 RepID=UPI0028DDE3EF